MHELTHCWKFHINPCKAFLLPEPFFESTVGKDSSQSALNGFATVSSPLWVLLIPITVWVRTRYLSIVHSCLLFRTTERMWQWQNVEDPLFTLNPSSTFLRSALYEVGRKWPEQILLSLVGQLTAFKTAADKAPDVALRSDEAPEGFLELKKFSFSDHLSVPWCLDSLVSQTALGSRRSGF